MKNYQTILKDSLQRFIQVLLIPISKTCNITPDLEISNDVRLTNVLQKIFCYLIVCLIPSQIFLCKCTAICANAQQYCLNHKAKYRFECKNLKGNALLAQKHVLDIVIMKWKMCTNGGLKHLANCLLNQLMRLSSTEQSSSNQPS